METAIQFSPIHDLELSSLWSAIGTILGGLHEFVDGQMI